MSGCLPMAGLILAAGSGSRMGKVKQLLPYAGQTLLGRAVDEAREAGLSPIVVVVGAHGEAVQASLGAKSIYCVRNPEWAQGMGSSIVAGAGFLAATDEDIGGLLILAPDQPQVRAEQLRELHRVFRSSGADIAAAEYGGTRGIPAAFGRKMFGRLRTLSPSGGAKSLLFDESLRVVGVPMPEAELDVDTPADWERFMIAGA